MPQFALLLSALIWGATYPSTKAVLAQLPPFSFMFVRFLLGTLLVVGWLAVVRRGLRCDRKTLRMSAVATVFLFLGFALQTVGLQQTTVANSAFITVLYVVLVPLYLRRFDGRTWLAAALAVAGLWLLIDPSVALNRGDLLTLGCAAAFAGHISCLERYTREGDQVSLFGWQMIFMTALMLPPMLMEGADPAVFRPTAVLLTALLVNGVLATGAFAVQVWAQRRLAAQRVALIFSLEPVFAAWLAWHFLGERLAGRGWLGTGLILTAVLIGAMSKDLAPAKASLESSPAA
jgi:drug/metabolite transporter (DMT)-like permease